MDLTPDTLLKDRYRIIRKLGQGGMGAVYLARDLSLDHEVALKANRSPVTEGLPRGDQFLREARLLASLRHPNLPRVTDYFILDGTQYLVMDYIPGDDLDELIKRSGPQPLGKVLAWARQLGGALSYLHHQNPPVIHRDIKPSNIKLTADGQAALVDFGIAKAIATDQGTATALHGYTPGFAPPEQYGEGHTGAHTDQYAFAATLYTLLSGVKPVDAIQRMLGQAVLTPLSVLVPGIPAALQAALERGLAVKPEDRFVSVDAFVEAFAAGASGSASPSDATLISQPGSPPILPPPPPPRVQTPRGGFPFLWIVVIGLGGLLILALLALGGLLLLRGAGPTRPAIPGTSATPVLATATDKPKTLEPTPQTKPSQTPPRPTATVQAASASATATLTPLPATATSSTTAIPPTATIPALGQGGLIAFVSDRADGKTLQIWTMRAWLNDQGKLLSGELRQLTDSPGDKRQPRWSPDGSELLYVAPGGAAGETDIWKMKADGSSSPVDLTKRKGSETEPAWSPDGKKIAFTENSRGDGVLQLYVMDADGSNPYKLSYDQDESSATWSPKMDWLGFVMNVAGNRIFYLRAPTDPLAAATAQPYYVTPQAFDHFDLKGSLGEVGDPVWSPDGGWIAYTSLKINAERVMIARFPLKAVDTDVIPLSNGTRDLTPAWSPDSQWLAYVSYRDGNSEIYVMRSTGKSQSRLTDAKGRDLDPNWQPLR